MEANPRRAILRWTIDSLGRHLGRHRALRALNLYPPFLGAGIRVVHIAPDLRSLEVELGLRPWTRNYVGTQFGGSLYMMCDPFFMLILIENLPRGYVVWDKAASIRFLRPGRGPVRARFHIPGERIEEIRREADVSGKTEARFATLVEDLRGEPVARVEKLVHVRKP